MTRSVIFFSSFSPSFQWKIWRKWKWREKEGISDGERSTRERGCLDVSARMMQLRRKRIVCICFSFRERKREREREREEAREERKKRKKERVRVLGLRHALSTLFKCDRRTDIVHLKMRIWTEPNRRTSTKSREKTEFEREREDLRLWEGKSQGERRRKKRIKSRTTPVLRVTRVKRKSLSLSISIHRWLARYGRRKEGSSTLLTLGLLLCRIWTVKGNFLSLSLSFSVLDHCTWDHLPVDRNKSFSFSSSSTSSPSVCTWKWAQERGWWGEKAHDRHVAREERQTSSSGGLRRKRGARKQRERMREKREREREKEKQLKERRKSRWFPSTSFQCPVSKMIVLTWIGVIRIERGRKCLLLLAFLSPSPSCSLSLSLSFSKRAN